LIRQAQRRQDKKLDLGPISPARHIATEVTIDAAQGLAVTA